MKKLNLVGQRFSSLTVLNQGTHKGNRIRWWCQCDCGGTALVTTDNLRAGTSTNCGCKRRAGLVERNTTHGLGKHPLYGLWCNIKNRCYNPEGQDYHLYGALGIVVCQAWHDFPTFVKDMGARPSLEHSVDRINPYGNYEPTNCRWATSIEQANNKRLPDTVRNLALND